MCVGVGALQYPTDPQLQPFTRTSFEDYISAHAKLTQSYDLPLVMTEFNSGTAHTRLPISPYPPPCMRCGLAPPIEHRAFPVSVFFLPPVTAAPLISRCLCVRASVLCPACAMPAPVIRALLLAGLGLPEGQDGPFAAAFVAHTALAIQAIPNLDILSFWTFTDVRRQHSVFANACWRFSCF